MQMVLKTTTTPVDGDATTTTETLNFTYDASGTPMSVKFGGTEYYYVVNIQGDIMAILNTSGEAVVEYTYDAWGKLYSTTGTLADTLGEVNPLTYRGYVYDHEIGMFYLQSRYYDPEVGRFINADGLISTGQGILGNNMFAYCGNDPVNKFDPTGYSWWTDFWENAKDWIEQKKEEAEKEENRTTAVGGTAAAAFGLSASLSLGYTSDTKGNVGIIIAGSIGGGFPSLGAGAFRSVNNAPTIHHQKGLGTSVGGSGGPGAIACGGEYNTIIDTKSDTVYHGYTETVTCGFYPTIVEVHGEASYSFVFGINLYDIGIGITNFFLGN